MLEFNDEYNVRQIVNVESDVRKPMFYKWFSSEQIEENATSCQYINAIKWDACVNKNPTTLANGVKANSTINFKAHLFKLDYLKIQYRFRHLKQTAEGFYQDNDYVGSVSNNLLPFKEAYKLASNEIIKLIDEFILTGNVLIQQDGKIEKRRLPNMYGLLNMPNQIDEEVEYSNKDKMYKIDKLFQKIKEGLLKLELGDEFSTPMMVLVDPITSFKLFGPCAITSVSSDDVRYTNDSGELYLIKAIKSINNRKEVYLNTSHLLKNQILIYPLSPNLIKLKPNKYMLPMLNGQVDEDSSDIAHSYLDFVLGGLLATDNTILRISIKES
ncbi:hypothetical protein bt91E135_001052 (plasmid) [Borrelia turicatae 91E135]|nr:hypothetical protein [Borrelia turicatae]UPA13715.1 hypothetical protein bt91E135_000891 [Borrelia turicatae 91E135]UPA13803.1 hypothetical protein bt91E135_000979 [Borrelia turicatae 91E135]UPA13858.1 hypothetical protein bt91E135_001052 [Borrelia turicatae 91E135]UPA15197.1 hypothetical protein btBTE5EL_000889 [Borrelia turicatae]UPA15239.1 hypothetical protein btBTE5EL_000932 [Borrelia turicatae]